MTEPIKIAYVILTKAYSLSVNLPPQKRLYSREPVKFELLLIAKIHKKCYNIANMKTKYKIILGGVLSTLLVTALIFSNSNLSKGSVQVVKQPDQPVTLTVVKNNRIQSSRTSLNKLNVGLFSFSVQNLDDLRTVTISNVMNTLQSKNDEGNWDILNSIIDPRISLRSLKLYVLDAAGREVRVSSITPQDISVVPDPRSNLSWYTANFPTNVRIAPRETKTFVVRVDLSNVRGGRYLGVSMVPWNVTAQPRAQFINVPNSRGTGINTQLSPAGLGMWQPDVFLTIQ